MLLKTTVELIVRDNTAIMLSQEKNIYIYYWKRNMPKGFSARRSDATCPLSCQIELRSVKRNAGT